MKGACSQPLIKDDQACSWLQHASSQVVASAVTVIPFPEQTELAEQLAEAGDLEQAAHVLANLLDMCELAPAEIEAHATRVLEFVDRVPMKDRSSACDRSESIASTNLQFYNTFGSALWEMAFGRQMQLMDRGAALDHKPM